MIKILLISILGVACTANVKNEVKQDTLVEKTVTATPALTDTSTIKKDNDQTTIRTGRHNFTIQWLGFSKNPGIAFINPATDGWYSIKGEQQTSEGYVKIDGKLKAVNPKELSFEGKIEYKIKIINSGEICEKNGPQTFLSTKNRKYWRMQDMTSCGGGTTDYIDIFF